MATISKRMTKSGLTFRIQVKIKDKGSGKIHVHSTTWKPPTGLSPKQIEREVQRYAEEYETDVKQTQTASRTTNLTADTTLSDYAKWWLERRKDEVSASYYVNCTFALEKVCASLGGYTLREISPTIIQQYYDSLDKEERIITTVKAKPALREMMELTGIGYNKLRFEMNLNSNSLCNAVTGKPISLGFARQIADCFQVAPEKIFEITRIQQKYAYETISKIKRTIRAVLATAKKQRLIADNYASADYISFPKRPPKTIEYMDDAEAKLFFKAADECDNIQYKTATLTLLLTGIRRGELCGLEWQDVDLENATITIARSLTTVRTIGLVLKDPKTESSKRVIAIPNKLVTVLTEYKAWYDNLKALNGDRWKDTNRVFINDEGASIYPGTINVWVKRICALAGIPPRTVHSIRHTNITMQIVAGVPLITVSGRAGHARTSTTTDVYSHFLKTSDRSAADKLDEIFN